MIIQNAVTPGNKGKSTGTKPQQSIKYRKQFA